MEIEEVEAVLEKIWDLHDKLSDAIHSISRTHFLKTSEKSGDKKTKQHYYQQSGEEDNRTSGYVFAKDFGVHEAIQEAKSLNAIRTALENLEDQLEFFHVRILTADFSFSEFSIIKVATDCYKFVFVGFA